MKKSCAARKKTWEKKQRVITIKIEHNCCQICFSHAICTNSHLIEFLIKLVKLMKSSAHCASGGAREIAKKHGEKIILCYG